MISCTTAEGIQLPSEARYIPQTKSAWVPCNIGPIPSTITLLAYYVSTHHCGYHKSSGSHTTAVFVAVLLLLPTSSSTDRQQLILYLRGTSLVVSMCHSRSDAQPTCRDHPIHVCTKLNIINFVCGIKLFRGYWSQINWHANVTLDTVIPYRSVEYVANLETRAVCSSIPQHMLHNHTTC